MISWRLPRDTLECPTCQVSDLHVACDCFSICRSCQPEIFFNYVTAIRVVSSGENADRIQLAIAGSMYGPLDLFLAVGFGRSDKRGLVRPQEHTQTKGR